jgi:hypothetical protein
MDPPVYHDKLKKKKCCFLIQQEDTTGPVRGGYQQEGGHKEKVREGKYGILHSCMKIEECNLLKLLCAGLKCCRLM